MSSESTSPPLPYLTANLSGIGGVLKSQPEDFVVEELPLYHPSGEGEHLYLWIEKRDVSGEFLLDHLAHKLGVSRNDIGMAGLKDRRAITRQFVSVPRQAESRIAAIDTDAIRVLQAKPHGNKLRTGHLAGNRFEILIRNPDAAGLKRLPELIARLRAQGFPNYYGDQRFGHDGETLDLGYRLLRGEATERDIPPKRRRFLLRLALSAVQSQLFNVALAERLRAGELHRVLAGDVLQVVASGGCFIAEDVPTEQARFDRREIVLTGPMFGPKMKSPTGPAADREQAVLNESGLKLDHFRRFPKLLPGTRRPLLVWPEALTAEAVDQTVSFHFTLPSGAYATTLLREAIKPHSSEEVDVPEAECCDESGELN